MQPNSLTIWVEETFDYGLISKHEDLTMTPQMPHEKPGVTTRACNPSTGAPWLAGLTSAVGPGEIGRSCFTGEVLYFHTRRHVHHTQTHTGGKV